ncbi:acyl-protein thioesterase 1-like [Ornithodoros turicata]|uniref:acyl-protein thioesterase 1-like n=1 Tax=Ornithodoros turicata TaxID=34597 RepID=UPI00313A26A5
MHLQFSRCMGNTASSMPSPVIVSATAKHTATVIFMHGLGDTGLGWSPILEAIRQPHIKYICPTAPTIPVTLNGGMPMPAWFDLFSLNPNGAEDEAGIKSATECIHRLIHEEEKLGIPSHRIVLGGFSMGGALALYSGFKLSKPLAGMLGLSCWLPLYKEFPAGAAGNQDTSVLLCHGDSDDLVPLKWGALTCELLKSFVKSVDMKQYRGMGHSSCEEEMKDISTFLQSRLPPV